MGIGSAGTFLGMLLDLWECKPLPVGETQQNKTTLPSLRQMSSEVMPKTGPVKLWEAQECVAWRKPVLINFSQNIII